MRMYLRWRSGTSTRRGVRHVLRRGGGDQVDHVRGERALRLRTLRGEHGTHRMVRISKYDNQGRRQTSFAGVDVTPVVKRPITSTSVTTTSGSTCSGQAVQAARA